MAFETIIREMDRIRNEEDMKRSFRFEPRNLNDYTVQSELKERALKQSKTVKEYKETEEAIRFASIEKGLDQDSDLKEMARLELTEQLTPLLMKDYQAAMSRYTELTTTYEETYASFQQQLKNLVAQSVNELLPITKELAQIEAANEYLFHSKGPYPHTMNLGIRELIDTDVQPIAKVPRTPFKPQKQVLMSELTQKVVYPFLSRMDTREALVQKLIEGVQEDE